MSKTQIGATTLVYPMPAVLAGADVDGKPNFLAIAWCGIACSQPPTISIAVQPSRYSLKGIKENLSFSVNVPSVEQVKETDYCGIMSGAKVDKVAACNFDVFYGEVEGAPMIEQCPVNLECRVVHMLELGSHWLVVGRIEATHVSDDCLTEGRPDVDKVRPFLFIAGSPPEYRAFGDVIARAFSVGREIEGG